MHRLAAIPVPWFRVSFFTLAILTLDQLSKAFILSSADTLAGASPTVGFTLVMNEGILFSLPVRGVWAYVLAAAVLGTVVPLLLRSLDFRARGSSIVLAAVLGGAVGNLIDRIRLGAVVDFVKVGWWPAFNVADASIVCAVLACIFFGKRLFLDRGTERADAAETRG